MNESDSEMMAATMRMMSVTSWIASQTSSKNDFGGFGGMTLEPNTSTRRRPSATLPARPAHVTCTVGRVASFYSG